MKGRDAVARWIRVGGGERTLQMLGLSRRCRKGLWVLNGYFANYTKYDIECLIIFIVVTTLSCSTLIFQFFDN
jgi:hypothetical protein